MQRVAKKISLEAHMKQNQSRGYRQLKIVILPVAAFSVYEIITKTIVLNRLLRPLAWLYGALTDVRNRLYDKGLREAYQPPVFLVSVGNLTVGGTGKTPHVGYLLEHWGSQFPMAVLSRGYGRRTKGFRLATDADTADTLGDEPLLLYRRYPTVTVAVGERRAEAIPRLLEAHPETRLIVLDDAYQHRPVQPHCNILLMDYNRPFYRDHPFPAGRLRERRHGARRADAVIVTKCPDGLPAKEQHQIAGAIQTYARAGVPVFFTGLRYAEPVGFGGGEAHPALEAVLLVTGIARPEPLEAYVQQRFRLVSHLRFADHHRYTASDLKAIRTALPPGAVVLTTEKDFVKLGPLLQEMGQDAARFYYFPIQISFLQKEAEFLRWLEEARMAVEASLVTNLKKT